MRVLHTYKYKMDQMNSKQEKVVTSIFLDAQGQLTLWSVVGSGRLSNSFIVIGPLVAEIFMFENVDRRKDGPTDGPTDVHRLDW